jgi:23S rRNA pseudouridine1911/1915/1917 synthase
MQFRCTVPRQFGGMPLEAYLAQRFTYQTLPQWREIVAQGRVRVGGAVAAGGATVAGGAEICYEPEEFEEPAADLNYRVVYEDDWLLGIDKPGDLLVHRAGKSFTNNLVTQIREGKGPLCPDAAAVNRLDRETSGIVLVARRAAHMAAFASALHRDDARKEYVAIVNGRFDQSLKEIDAPIGREGSGAESYRHGVVAGGKSAITRVLRVRHLGDSHSLVRLSLVTGRTHQVRVHCAHVGCPVVGDRLYGASSAAGAQRGALREGLIARQALHCERVDLWHPFLKQTITIHAPIPADMESVLQKLGRHA